MSVLLSFLTVLFVLLSILLVIIILLQSDKSAGMGILGGSSQSAFGSSTADVITKITSVMIALFMLGSLGLAILESKRSGLDSIEKGLSGTGKELSSTTEDNKKATGLSTTNKSKPDDSNTKNK